MWKKKAQPVAPVRQRPGNVSPAGPRGCTPHAPPSDKGQPWSRTREEKRHHRFRVPRDALPTQWSSFRLLVLVLPDWMRAESYRYGRTREESCEGQTVGLPSDGHKQAAATDCANFQLRRLTWGLSIVAPVGNGLLGEMHRAFGDLHECPIDLAQRGNQMLDFAIGPPGAHGCSRSRNSPSMVLLLTPVMLWCRW